MPRGPVPELVLAVTPRPPILRFMARASLIEQSVSYTVSPREAQD